MEPVEGQFDFTLVDRTIDVARQQQLKIVPLWFGAWKNSMSCYAPAWFKRDVKRFPRAVTKEGKPLEIASCFSNNVLQADLKAFSALMQHIAERDPQRQVVIMMQIENEIGMLESRHLLKKPTSQSTGLSAMVLTTMPTRSLWPSIMLAMSSISPKQPVASTICRSTSMPL